MQWFRVVGKRIVEEELLMMADSPQDAAKIFREQNPDFRIEIVEDGLGEEWEHIARCESCSVDLFEGDEYGMGVEGLHFCMECTAALIADERLADT